MSETVTDRLKVKSLPCRLTEEEIDQRARQNAAKVQELINTKVVAKDEADDWKQKIKGLESQVQELTHIVNSGVEYRPVEVYEQSNYALGLVEVVRRDTYEVIDCRAMLPHEKQHRLPLDEREFPAR